MKRISSLEGLRGLAVIMVLFSHLGVMFYPAYYWGGVERHCELIEYYLGETPFSFFWSGNSGVMVFLVLTGFGSYMVCDKGRESCVKYASLRFFKLSILMFISTIIIWILFKFNLVYFFDIVEDTRTIWIQGYNPYNDDILSLFLGNWFTISTVYNSTLWTIQYIFIGSIICILIYSLWGGFNKEYVVSLSVGLLLLIMNMPYYIACVLGYTLANYYKKNLDRRINIMVGICLFLIAIFLCGFPMVIESRFFLYGFFPKQYVEYYHMIGAFLLVYICLFCNPVKRIVESNFFIALGKYSMSIYIIHFAVLISVTSYLFTKAVCRTTYNRAVLFAWIATMLVTYGIAVLLKSMINRVYGVLDIVYDKFCKG